MFLEFSSRVANTEYFQYQLRAAGFGNVNISKALSSAIISIVLTLYIYIYIYLHARM